MTTDGRFTRWIRLVLAAAMAVALGMAVQPSGAPIAEATGGAFFPQTGFEIDGNLAADGVEDGDWLAGYGAGATPGGFPTTGVYYNERTPDPCNDPADDIAAGGIEVGEGPVWPEVTGSPNNKTDLLAIRIGAEAVSVPAAGGSQINNVLYVAFETCNSSSGTFNLTIFIEGGDGLTPFLADGTPTGTDDDFLIIFDFQGGSTGSGVLYDFNGVEWVQNATITAEQFQQFMNPDRTVGEVAVNLTSLGIPSDGTGGPGEPNEEPECRTLTIAGQAATPTGGSLNSQVKDLIDVAPLQISNCGAIDITKLAADGSATATDPFHYVLDQTDGAPVHDAIPTLTSTPTGLGEPDADLSEIDADIDLGATHNWVNVLSQPDYDLEEVSLPVGWELQTIECTYYDIFPILDDLGNVVSPPGERTVVLHDQATGGDTGEVFLVPPATFNNAPLDPASCEIVNDALGITIVKDGVGTPDTVFTFDVDGGVATDLPVTINGDSVFQTVPAVGTYTITEDDINALDVGDLEPDWSLDDIVCVDGDETSGAPVYDLAAGTATVTVDGADDDVVCTFTNNQAARIIVEKVTDPDTADTFDFDVTGAAVHDLDGVANGGSATTGDTAPGDYTITEVMPASDPAWVLTAVSCGAINPDGLSVDVSVAAGETVTCQFSNQQQGAIVIDKQVVEPGTTTVATDQDTTFSFTGDAGGEIPGSITTTAGVTAAGDELVSNPVMPGAYTVTEDTAATAGYTLESVTCSDDDSVQSGDGASINVASGETVSCTFTNSRNQATFTLAKNWGAGTLDGESVDLAASAAGPAPLDTAIATTATSLDEASVYSSADQSMTVYSGQTITFSEAFAGAIGDGYITSLDCGDVGTMVLTPDADNRGGTLAVGDTPSDATCTFTNTPKTAGVALQKNWAANSNVGDTVTLGLSTAPTGDSDTAISTAADAPVFIGPDDVTDNTAFVGVVAGDTVTFTEDLGAVAANYTTTFDCVGATNTPVAGADVYTWTLLIDTADVDSGETIFCSFTNTRIEVDLILEKDWNDAKVGDAVTLSATGSDTTPIELSSTAAAADQTDTSPAFTVYAGEQLTLAEVFDTGDPAAYDTSLSCTGAADTDVADGVLDIAPADTSITCTWVNARRSVDVLVAKDVEPDGDDGTFDITLNGDPALTAVADGPDADPDPAPDATSAPFTIFIGDTVSLVETAAGATDLANYTSTLTCDNGISPADNTGVSGDFVVPSTLASDTQITCTFVNVRNEAELTVTKSWGTSPVDPDPDVVDLTISGGLATPVGGSNSNDGVANDLDALSTVYGGEAITVAEIFQGSRDASHYDTSLVCTDADGNLVDTVDSLDGVVDVPADPTDITCTFTNQRKSTSIVVDKVWVNAQAGDAAEITLTGVDAASPATGTSTVIQPNQTDSPVTSMTVWSGETVSVDEVITLTDPQDAPRYASTLTCGADVTQGRSGTVDITPADTDPITCTFRNERRGIDLVLTKDWSTSPANGDTVGLYIDGGLIPAPFGNPDDVPATAPNSNDGDDANDVDASARVLVGETITLSEVFDVGDAADYDTTFECLDPSGAVVTTSAVTDLESTLEITAEMANLLGDYVCTFTNVRKSTDLVLEKAWVGAVSGDTADLTATGQDGALVTGTDTQTATAPAGDGTSATTANITVYAGQTVTLSEALGAGNTATYDATAFACTSGDQSPAWVAGDVSAALDVSAADVDAAILAGEPITCTFTNTAQRGTIVVVKSIDGVNDGTFDFSGDWSTDGVTIDPVTVTDPAAFSITTDGLTGTVTFTDVLIGSYTVSETDSGASFDGTSVTCVEAAGDDGSGPDGGTDLPLTGTIDLDDGETVTCTFTNTERSTIVVVKDAQPDAAQDFSFTTTEPDTFDLLTDAFDLDDDADGTLSNTYTSVLVPGGETYTVTELATAGWTLDPSSSCTTGGDFNGTTATITPAPGTTVTCTFVNTANPAGLSATKAVEGQVGPWGPFEFTLSGGTFTGDATQAVDSVDSTADWTDLVEGQLYTLTEAQVPGYEAGAEFTCVVILPGSNGAVELLDADGTTDGFQFTAVAGAVYDCDITNVAIPGSVDVTKTVTGVADDYDWSFEFTIDPDAPPSNPQSASGTGNVTSSPVTWTDLLPGATYTVTETSVPGWTAGAIECTVTPADPAAAPVVTTDGSFAVTPGSTVSCDFDNAADPGSVDVTKTVTGVDDTLAWSFDLTIDPFEGTVAPSATQTASGTGNTTSGQVTWTGLVPGETYTITETVPAGWTQGPIACTITRADQTTEEITSATFTVEPGDSISCDFDNAADPGTVEVTKTVTGVDDALAWSFDFSIAPLPDGETNPQTASGVGNVTSSPVGWANLVPGTEYTITETVPAGWTQGPIACTITRADQTTEDTTSATFTVEPGDSISCDFDNAVNPSEVSVTKTVDGGLADAQGWAFEFTLTPDADPAGSQTASGTGDSSNTVTWTNLVPGTEYVLAEVLPGTNTTTYDNGVLTCTGVDDTDSDDQTVTFVAPLGGDGVEVDCTVTNTAQSNVTISKVVDSVTRDADTGTWTITYLVNAVNADDAGAGVYTLNDSFDFGAGVTIVDGSASVTNTVPSGIVTNAAFDGVGDPNVVTDEAIPAATTHTYLVSVDVTIAVGPDTDGDCIAEPGEGTGFLNTVEITVDGGEPQTTEACAGFAQLTLVKNLVNDDGGNATVADFPLTATGPAVLTGVSGTDAVSSAVPAGNYGLSEQMLVAGYTASDFVCEGGSLLASTVTLADGDNATCTITNDDEPVDLELTKDDGGVEAVAGGAPFDYTISVQNIGDRDVDLDEPVTVTDELPAGLTWVSFPGNCSQAAQTLTCDIDPALLPAGGDAVVITATVQAEPDAPSGVYVNKASVTTEDDPSTDPECPALDDNNVDCEETPVDRDGGVQIIKTDDVADGESVQPGDTFTYELVVTNTGVSTLLPGTHVEDDLPAQLGLVSVEGGAGWTCNDTDPIDCDYAPELAPGESAPAITVTVLVAADATGEFIENVAIVRAAVDRDCPADRLVESFDPACNEVTDDDDETTPLNPNADLAIVKTASVAQIGAGGGFDWTLEVTNNGPGTAVNVVIGDVVPSVFEVAAVTSSDFECGNDGNDVECTIASLAVGAGGSVTISVTVPADAAGGEVTNIGTVESDTPDPDLSNNSDDAVVVVVAQAPPPPEPPPVTLPRTGSDVTHDMVRTATLLLLMGGAVILITRRRRSDDLATD